MKIAIASGKGGTGKTTVATNLALSINDDSVGLLDCDVEEPNCHIFIKSNPDTKESIFIQIPQVDESKCTLCGKCGDFCEFNAIVSLKTKPLVFPELCHGCGGCEKVCPENAISEIPHEIGTIEISRIKNLKFVKGCLNVREIMSPHLINSVKKHATEKISIIDSPPGTTCPMIAAVRKNDFVVLVTEPTPFGFHDLKLAVETVKKLGLNFGIVINRFDIGSSLTEDYCQSENVPVLLRINDDKKIAEVYSKGKLLVEELPQFKKLFSTLYSSIKKAYKT